MFSGNYKNKNFNYLEHSHLDTKMVRYGSVRSQFGETSEAIFFNSGFCYNSAEIAQSRFDGENPGFVYSRYSNPNLRMLEKRLSALESAEDACVTASGMASVFSSIMCQIKSGDHVIFNDVLFGSCYYIASSILPNYNIEVSFISSNDRKNWHKYFQSNTKLVFIETPANPNLDIIDIEYIAGLCRKNNTKLIVDNIFASPYCQKPLEFGADIVVYSSTKHLDGQGRSMGGAIIGKEEFIQEILLPFHRHTGPALSPFNAWIILKSLETFSLRIERQCCNASKISIFLQNHPMIEDVFYPHLDSHPQYDIAKKQMKKGGSMIAFKIKGNKKKTFTFLNNLNIIDISNNLGDTKSLITHPSTTTHANIEKKEKEAIGITDNLCRLSIGIEHYTDLIKDLDQALSS